MKKRSNGLSKYDAPLKIQYQRGVTDFKRGFVSSPFHPNTMQAREWQRGFNTAYYENLDKVVKNELARTRSA